MADTPQHSTGIGEREVSHCPRSIFWRAELDAEPFDEALRRYMLVPVVGVLDEQVHHEVVRQLLDVEVLKQERAATEMEIRQVVGRERHLEADRLVELLRALEITCWQERLDLDGCQIQCCHWDLT